MLCVHIVTSRVTDFCLQGDHFFLGQCSREKGSNLKFGESSSKTCDNKIQLEVPHLLCQRELLSFILKYKIIFLYISLLDLPKIVYTYSCVHL